MVNYSSPSVTNVLFTGNTAAWRGGGIGILRQQSNPVFTNITLAFNTASIAGWNEGGGGGIAIWNGANASIINTVVYDNSAINYGGDNIWEATDEPADSISIKISQINIRRCRT